MAVYDEFDGLMSDGSDMLEIEELPRERFEASRPGPSTNGNKSNLGNSATGTPGASYAEQQRLNAEIADVDGKIRKLDEEIRQLQDNRQLLLEDRATLNQKLQDIKYVSYGNQKGKGRATGRNYFEDKFVWKGVLEESSLRVFGIPSFRLCQEGVCNANMDGRDIVCVMPTGGGKSLTYQLPAVISSGVTLVISPLLSLISDQIMHLTEAGVAAVKLTGSTSKETAENITRRLQNMARGQISEHGDDIKLFYATPEKVVQSKRFQNLLQKLADASKLDRIVIDEAHCVSQLGHDFRPDYAKLRVLRQLFPHVPIMALSATCPPQVLKDLLKILGLAGVVDGRSAPPEGTVYFSSPLYRKNLHYSLIMKHNESNRVMDDMVAWIKEHHPNDSGIVYCLSKKDAEKVAEELSRRGGIRTGVYHADRTDSQKEHLHAQWRKGDIKVVCATIAFGLGIDKGDVRFVLHHSVSKSLDGFYQESGRAGRDGKDSDCALFYRPQDAATLSSMTYHEKEGTSKLHGMLQFAQDLRTCRKLQFANYFSHSSQLSINSWSTEEESAHQKCGHCDNCTRPPDDIEERDVTLQTWQILKILRDVLESGGSVTATMLAGLVRGTGGAAFNVAGGGKGKRKAAPTKASVDLEKVCGGKVDLKKDEIEFLLVELILQQFLAESPQVTPYHTVMYMKLGRRAPQVDRLSRADVENGNVTPVKVWFKRTKKASKTKAKEKEKEPPSKSRRSSSGTGKRGRPRKSAAAEDDVIVDGDDEGRSVVDLSCEVRLDSDIDDQDEDDEYDQTVLAPVSRRASVRRSMSSRDDNDDIEEEDSEVLEGDGDGWLSGFRQGPPRKRLKQTPGTSSIETRSRSQAPPSRRASLSPDIIDISSD